MAEKNTFLDKIGLTRLMAGINRKFDNKADKTHAHKVARANRLTVGTTAGGWTANDCDYLCDGVNDQEEINAAIAALPTNGGEVVLLDGTYNLTGEINISKPNTTLMGNGNNTILKRAFAKTGQSSGLVNITGNYCTVKDLTINGASSSFSNGVGVFVSGMSAVVTHLRIFNCAYDGIRAKGQYCKITHNTLDGCQDAIYSDGTNAIVEGNHCILNTGAGIYVLGNICSISGNMCEANSAGIAVASSNNVITGNICQDNTGRDFYIGGTGNVVEANTAHNADTEVPGIEFLSSAKKTIIGNNRISNGLIEVKGTDIEWANPPMVPGVEYATTERYNGKIVYTKALEVALSGVTSQTVDTGLSSPSGVISMTGVLLCGKLPGSDLDGAFLFPFPVTSDDKEIKSDVYMNMMGKVQVRTFIDLGSCTAKIVIKYVK